jgi:hypothetical protein
VPGSGKDPRNLRENDGIEITRHDQKKTPSARLEPEHKGEARLGFRYPDSLTEATGGRTFNNSEY